MRYGSLFSGIGGFDYGFDRAGWECAWQVEQEAFCNAILKTHWPTVQRFPDVRDVGAHNLQPVDCITAGVPCQDVSIAGRRAGLKGKRTGLFYQFARILQELRPPWFVFENVPGLFSSNDGRDFAEILRILMVECGYGVSWRVLDSQFFGVAQQRRRLFIVGSLERCCPAEILFDSTHGNGDSAARGKTGQDVSHALTVGSGSGYRLDPNGETLVVAQTITENYGRSRGCTGGNNGVPTNLFVLQDVRGRREKRENGIGIRNADICFTLDKTSRHAVAFAENQRAEVRTSETVPSLSSGGGKPGSGYPAILCEEAYSEGVRETSELPAGLDSPRYRALGNAVTATVAEWIGRRLMCQPAAKPPKEP